MTRIKFGRKGIAPEYVPVIIIFIVLGVVFLVSFIYSHFTEVGGPPAGPSGVMKYYDDMLKGEIDGKKVTPTAIVLGFFIPLLASFSIFWALLGILPVFREPTNKPAAAVLSLGVSVYATPTMSWIIIGVFPTMLGVSAIFIAIAATAAALFIMLSTFLWYRKIHKHGTSYPSGAERGRRRPWEREEEKKDKDIELRKEVDNLIIEIRDKFLPDCDKAIRDKNVNLADTYKISVADYWDRFDKLRTSIDKSKLPDWAKDTDKGKLELISRVLRDRFDKLDKIEKATPSRKELEKKYLDTLERAREFITEKKYNEFKNQAKTDSDAGLIRTIEDLEETMKTGIPPSEKGKKCPHCGTVNRKDAEYCLKCGKELKPGELGLKPGKTKEDLKPLAKNYTRVMNVIIAIDKTLNDPENEAKKAIEKEIKSAKDEGWRKWYERVEKNIDDTGKTREELKVMAEKLKNEVFREENVETMAKFLGGAPRAGFDWRTFWKRFDHFKEKGKNLMEMLYHGRRLKEIRELYDKYGDQLNQLDATKELLNETSRQTGRVIKGYDAPM